MKLTFKFFWGCLVATILILEDGKGTMGLPVSAAGSGGGDSTFNCTGEEASGSGIQPEAGSGLCSQDAANTTSIPLPSPLAETSILLVISTVTMLEDSITDTTASVSRSPSAAETPSVLMTSQTIADATKSVLRSSLISSVVAETSMLLVSSTTSETPIANTTASTPQPSSAGETAPVTGTPILNTRGIPQPSPVAETTSLLLVVSSISESEAPIPQPSSVGETMHLPVISVTSSSISQSSPVTETLTSTPLMTPQPTSQLSVISGSSAITGSDLQPQPSMETSLTGPIVSTTTSVSVGIVPVPDQSDEEVPQEIIIGAVIGFVVLLIVVLLIILVVVLVRRKRKPVRKARRKVDKHCDSFVLHKMNARAFVDTPLVLHDHD